MRIWPAQGCRALFSFGFGQLWEVASLVPSLRCDFRFNGVFARLTTKSWRGAQLLTRQLNSPWRCNFIANPLYSKCTKVALPRCFIRALREPVLASRQEPFQGSASGGKSRNSGQSARLTGKQQLRPGGRRLRVRCSRAAISTACFVGTQKTKGPTA